MKRQTVQHVVGTDKSMDADPAVVSAETALCREIAELGEWLTAQGSAARDGPDRPEDDSRDQLYWRHGYLMGLQHALARLTTNGATVH